MLPPFLQCMHVHAQISKLFYNLILPYMLNEKKKIKVTCYIQLIFVLLGRRKLNIYSHLNLMFPHLHVIPTRLFDQISCLNSLCKLYLQSCFFLLVSRLIYPTGCSTFLLEYLIDTVSGPNLLLPGPLYLINGNFPVAQATKLKGILDSSLSFYLLHSVTISC